MASIFLSYRRTDSPQACRVHDWLVGRFGADEVFMDIAAIPFAVSYRDFIREAIVCSKVLVALIGAQWLTKISQIDDPIRTELEIAIASHIPILPVLIGNTSMPTAEELPASLLSIASQNATVIGVLHDFDSHMRSLLPKIESILEALAAQSAATSNPFVIHLACKAVMEFLRARAYDDQMAARCASWQISGTVEFRQLEEGVALFLHRVVRLAELLELHFILSFWFRSEDTAHVVAGWVIHQFEKSPIMPEEFLARDQLTSEYKLKIRASDEDARQVWRMITDLPLRLSLAYVATVSSKTSA